MAKITAQIQWASNVDQLKSQIREGTGSIIAMKDAVDKTARSLGGEGLMRAAHNTTAAVQQLGGVTKLTAAEKERINQQLTKVIEKYTLLGQKAPPAMLELEAATRKTEAAGNKFSNFLGQANGLLATFGVGLSVGAIVGFGRNLLNTADELVKVADRTGLTTTEVQRLGYIAGQSGNTLDQMTSAVSKLQNGLVREDGGVVATVKALGLNFDTLRKANPYDMMEQVAAAIAKVPDPTARASMAMALFGRAGAEILPTLIADFEGLGASAPVMSDKTVRALEQAGDSLSHFTSVLKVGVAEAYNFMGSFFDAVVTGGMMAVDVFLRVVATIIETVSKLPGMSTAFDKLGISADGVRQKAQWFTDAAKAQMNQMQRLDTEVRNTTGAFVDFDPTVDKASTSMTAAARAAEAAAEAQKKFTLSIEESSFAVRRLVTNVGAVPPAIQSMDVSLSAAATQLLAWNTIVPRATLDLKKLENALYNMPPAIESMGVSAEVTTQKTQGVFGTMFGNMKDLLLGKGGGAASGGLAGMFAAAFTGGGGALGAVKGFATQAVGSLLGMVPVVGPFLQQFAGPLIAGFGKIGAAFKRMFGGPSAEELGGRDVAREFDSTVNEMFRLIEDRVEPAHEQWERNAILLREAYIGLGHDAPTAIAKASAALDRLHKAEKQGADAAKLVMDEIVGVLEQGLSPAAEKFGDTATAAFASVGREGAGAFDLIIDKQRQLFAEGEALMRKHGINVPNGGAGEGTSSGRNASEIFKGISEADARAMWLSMPGQRADGSTDSDWQRVKDQYGFAAGTHGQFMDFGAGTNVTLHGRERVVTESEGRNEGRALTRLVDRVEAVMARQDRQARQLEDALLRAFTYGPTYARAR